VLIDRIKLKSAPSLIPLLPAAYMNEIQDHSMKQATEIPLQGGEASGSEQQLAVPPSSLKRDNIFFFRVIYFRVRLRSEPL